jgi:hypothetical protein
MGLAYRGAGTSGRGQAIVKAMDKPEVARVVPINRLRDNWSFSHSQMG